MSQRYISLDPGGSTGWATRNAKGEITGGTLDTENHQLALWKLLKLLWPQQVICERFNYQRRDLDKGVSLEIISRNYIGVVELYCQKYEVPLYMSQVPNKDFWSDQNLKDLSLWIGSKHTRDAVRHLLWYLTMIEKDQQYLQVKRSIKRSV